MEPTAQQTQEAAVVVLVKLAQLALVVLEL
jgi:hypothetical protein